MEEEYGPPSKITTSSGSVMLTYAWSDAGFIPDLDAQEPRDITYTGWGGRVLTEPYQPCQPSRANAFDTDSAYTFD